MTWYVSLFDGEDFSQRIRAKLERDGHTFREAAPMVPTSRATLCRIAQGHTPDVETYLRVCRWLSEPVEGRA